MTRKTNGRIAGLAYLLYIAVAFPDMVLFGRATSGHNMAAKLASIAQHTTDLHISVVLSLMSGFCALVLAVTLYALTRDQDPDLAMLALTCRVGEGITGIVGIPTTLGLLWLASSTGADAPDPAAAQAIAGFLLKRTALVSASLFAVGSTIFCWLLLRGRMIPTWLAWLGFIGSAVLVIALPLELAQVLRGPVTLGARVRQARPAESGHHGPQPGHQRGAVPRR